MRIYTRKFNILFKLIPKILFILLFPFINPLCFGFIIAAISTESTSSAYIFSCISFVFWFFGFLIIAFVKDKEKKENTSFVEDIHDLLIKKCNKKNYTIEMVKINNKLKGVK